MDPYDRFAAKNQCIYTICNEVILVWYIDQIPGVFWVDLKLDQANSVVIPFTPYTAQHPANNFTSYADQHTLSQ